MELCIHREVVDQQNLSEQSFSYASSPNNIAPIKQISGSFCMTALSTNLSGQHIFFWQLKYNSLTILSLTASVSMAECQANSTDQLWQYDYYNNTEIRLNDSGSCLILSLQLYPLLIVLSNSKLDFCIARDNSSIGSTIKLDSCGTNSTDLDWSLLPPDGANLSVGIFINSNKAGFWFQ